MKYVLVVAYLLIVPIVSGQVFTISIDTIHTFRHLKEIDTNDAIDQNKIILTGSYNVTMMFRLDVDNKSLTRIIDCNPPVIMPIVYLHETAGCYNIVAEYTDLKTKNVGYPNYTFSKLPGGNYIIELRILQNDEIQGWFNDAARVIIEKR